MQVGADPLAVQRSDQGRRRLGQSRGRSPARRGVGGQVDRADQRGRRGVVRVRLLLGARIAAQQLVQGRGERDQAVLGEQVVRTAGDVEELADAGRLPGEHRAVAAAPGDGGGGEIRSGGQRVQHPGRDGEGRRSAVAECLQGLVGGVDAQSLALPEQVHRPVREETSTA